VADIKSEPRPASNRNQWPASYWNAWPASSVSALERRNPGFVLLKQIGSGGILIEVAGLVLLHPDPDQVSTDGMALGEPVKSLTGQELLSDLALELDAVRAVFGHGLPSFESPARRSIPSRPIVRPRGPTPIRGQFCAPIDRFGADGAARPVRRAYFSRPCGARFADFRARVWWRARFVVK
jgi:hypothetical protein